MDLSGIWKTNDGGVYYLRRVDNDLWWLGEHPEDQWFNLFKGTVVGDSIEGEWIDAPKGRVRNYGSLILSCKNNKIISLAEAGAFKGFEWKKENMIALLTGFTPNQNQFLTSGFNETDNMTGGWISDDSGFFYLREHEEYLWGMGEHPKRNWVIVFKGIRLGTSIKCEWIDLPKGKRSGKGNAEFCLDPETQVIRRVSETGGFTSTSLLKLTGKYFPGEIGFDPDYHPAIWNLKWEKRSGLNDEAYDSIYRAPYIQNITADSATVIWRVSLPPGTNPATVIDSMKAEALIAPRDIPIANGTRYTIKNGISVSDCSWTYNLKYGTDLKRKLNPKDPNLLSSVNSRPTIQFRVRFSELEPGTIYHYRIKSDALDPSNGLNNENTDYITLANDVYFKTANLPGTDQPFRFLAMGDLGPGKEKPSYYYDVFDLFHDVARKFSPELWLVPGDLENCYQGHPNAMDPFFFNVYNAYQNHNFGDIPRWSSAVSYKARETKIKAFQKPPYYGILGGIPVYPAVGNQDLGMKGKLASLENWRKSYLGNFELPSDESFNQAGQGLFYTFRSANVIFVSLAIPGPAGKSSGIDWWSEWGYRQRDYLKAYLGSLKEELSDPNTWLVVYFHDYHWGYSPNNELQTGFSKLLAELGADVVIMGHQHFFAHKTVKYGDNDYRAIVVGTGGFSSRDACKRPGFIMANIYQNSFEYWKFDTHKCQFQGEPENRDAISPMVREYCSIKKLGFGKHEVKEMDLNSAYIF